MSLRFVPDANASSSYVGYGSYVLNDQNANEPDHVDDGMSLADFRERKQLVVKSTKSAVEDGVLILPGETEDLAVFRFASDQCKKIIRTLLKAMMRNRKRGICFTPFDATNVFVSSSGNAKLRNIHVLTNLTQEELHVHQQQNYLCVHEIISGIFDWNPPPDIQHLLNLIHTGEASDIYHIHGSLIPMANYAAFFKVMYDHIRFVVPDGVLRDILHSLIEVPYVNEYPYVATWKELIGSNELLLIPFNKKPETYVVPADRPNQATLTKFQKAALRDLGLDPEMRPISEQTSLTPEQIELIEVLQFCEYLRNRSSHRLEPWKQWMKDDKLYEAEGSERVSYIRFPMIVVHFQFQLYQRNRHREIDMEKFF